MFSSVMLRLFGETDEEAIQTIMIDLRAIDVRCNILMNAVK
jgi:hypothetical protein